MASEEQCRLLARRIRGALRLGLHLDRAVMDFIGSTCGNLTAGQLKALLEDTDDPENASLCDLVFSPDNDLQCRLEATLGEAEYRDRDVWTVAALLCEAPLEIRLMAPGGRFDLWTRVPDWAVGGLVVRLNIGRRLNAELLETVGRWVEPDRRTAVNVRLRNRRFTMTADRSAFFRALLERVHSRDLMAGLDFMLELMAEPGPETDIGRLLTQRHHAYRSALQASEKAAACRACSNMETLLLAGVRTPHIDAADTRRRMRLMDRVHRAVFRTTIAPVPRARAVETAVFSVQGPAPD